MDIDIYIAESVKGDAIGEIEAPRLCVEPDVYVGMKCT